MVQNIRLINPNMTRVGSYFYSFNEETDIMVQKADDGTLAFSYPLDTPISQEVNSLEHDGESFWTMEDIDGTPANGFRIRRWIIANFVMVLQQTFTFDTDSTDTFEADAFTIEHYEGTLTSGAIENTTTFNVSFDTTIFNLITPGTRLFLGPSSKAGFVGEEEAVTVNSTGSGNQITITSSLTNGFIAGDKVVFSKNIWFFNENFQKTLGVGAIYKASVADGAIQSRDQGGAFLGIESVTFHEVNSFTGSLTSFNKPYVVFIRTTNLLFLNPNDSNLTIELSAVQNNLSIDTTIVFPIFDMGIEGETIFRLQKQFNINGTESTETTFNYQLATFRPFPTAIAITATPAILPADSGASSSTIVATVTDQYALAFVTSPASTIVFSTSGGGTGSSIPTGSIALDSKGQATVTYTTGNTAGLVTISATVTIA